MQGDRTVEALNSAGVHLFLLGSVLLAAVELAGEAARQQVAGATELSLWLAEGKAALVGTLAYLLGSLASTAALYIPLQRPKAS